MRTLFFAPLLIAASLIAQTATSETAIPQSQPQIALSFAPVDGSAEVISSQTGSWAFLRLLRSGALTKTAQPDVFNLRLSAQGYSASFDLRANSVENPFDLTMFSGFACPRGF